MRALKKGEQDHLEKMRPIQILPINAMIKQHIKLHLLTLITFTTLICIADTSGQQDTWYTYKEELIQKSLSLKNGKVSPATAMVIIETLKGLSAYSNHQVSGLSWLQIRRLETELLLNLMRDLSGQIDKNWDPQDLPEENVATPRGAGLPSGVDPKVIKDQALREQYEAAIKKNGEKAAEYEDQLYLHRTVVPILAKLQKYIVKSYLTDPPNIQELEQLLDENGIDSDEKVKMLRSVGLTNPVSCSVIDWGESVNGVQLAITSSNTIITIGTKVQLTCFTRNMSTNRVIINVSDPKVMFEISLIGTSGELYELNNPASIDVTMNTSRGINSNEVYETRIPIRINKNIKPGNYKIKATQVIYVEQTRHDLISNLLDLKLGTR